MAGPGRVTLVCLESWYPHGPGNPLAAPITNCSWTPLGIYFGGCKAERCYFQSSSEPSLIGRNLSPAFRYESLSYRLFLERYGVTQYEDSSSGRTLAESWKLSAVLELRIKSQQPPTFFSVRSLDLLLPILSSLKSTACGCAAGHLFLVTLSEELGGVSRAKITINPYRRKPPET